MTIPELIADLPLPPGHPREGRMYFRMYARYLADHVYTAELADGSKVHDVSDVAAWLREAAEAVRVEAKVTA